LQTSSPAEWLQWRDQSSDGVVRDAQRGNAELMRTFAAKDHYSTFYSAVADQSRSFIARCDHGRGAPFGCDHFPVVRTSEGGAHSQAQPFCINFQWELSTDWPASSMC